MSNAVKYLIFCHFNYPISLPLALSVGQKHLTFYIQTMLSIRRWVIKPPHCVFPMWGPRFGASINIGKTWMENLCFQNLKQVLYPLKCPRTEGNSALQIKLLLQHM